MNLSDIHIPGKEVSAKALFMLSEGSVTALQILAGGLLKEHITQSPALLLCVQGEVVYEDEQGQHSVLTPGHYREIAPRVKHRVSGVQDSQLLLIK